MTAADPLAGVSRETEQALEAFAALVARWTARINLVSARSLPEIRTRHIADSAQVWHAAARRSGHWLDLGSGGGFPGLVCAILARGEGAPVRFTLVDSDARKAAFLTTAARELGLTVTVLARRIESLPPMAADIVTARALAPLPQLLDLAAPHLAPGGEALFPKGAGAEAEIAAARTRWRFKLDRVPSITDPTASLLRIGDLQRV